MYYEGHANQVKDNEEEIKKIYMTLKFKVGLTVLWNNHTLLVLVHFSAYTMLFSAHAFLLLQYVRC